MEVKKFIKKHVYIIFSLIENDFAGKRSPKSFYESISLEIPDENVKKELVKNINNFESFQQNPILSASPTKIINIIENINKKEENIVSFNEELSKMFHQQEGQNNEESFQKPCQINKNKKHLNLKDSVGNKENIEKFLNEVSESLEKNPSSLFFRNKTPEFAKIFQNYGKEQNFFKFEKPKDQLSEKYPQPSACSKESKIFDANDFSEKKNEDFHGNLQNRKIFINRIETQTQEEQNDVHLIFLLSFIN